MTPTTRTAATLDDLARVKERAELINGRIVRLIPSGMLPARVARRILRALDDYSMATGRGEAFGDNLAYAFGPPKPALPSGRRSLSPDSSLFAGTPPSNPMRFVDGPPAFAVEVRSESDYGPKMDREYDEKRADYFFAGTEVVWDVDPVAETVTAYRASAPAVPVVFRRGDEADAEPALPGWRLPVADLFA